MAIAVTPLHPTLGAAVRGIDLTAGVKEGMGHSPFCLAWR